MAKQHDSGQNNGAIAVPEKPTGEVTILSKVKLGKTIEIHCSVIDPKFTVENRDIKFSSSDKPVEEFVTALNAFVPELILFAGLDEEAWQNAEIVGISFTQAEGDEPGITISGKCRIGEAGLVACVTTPYITPSVVGEYASIGSKIANLQRQAIAYIRGERKIKQLELLEASNPIRGIIGA